MSAQVLPIVRPLDRVMAQLAAAEAVYQSVREAHADAMSLVGLATYNGTLTVAHRHAAEALTQRLRDAGFERDAAIVLALRAWGQQR